MSAYFLWWECQFSVAGEIAMNDDAWISKKEIVMKSIQMNGDDYDEYDDNEKRIWNESGNFYDGDDESSGMNLKSWNRVLLFWSEKMRMWNDEYDGELFCDYDWKLIHCYCSEIDDYDADAGRRMEQLNPASDNRSDEMFHIDHMKMPMGSCE